MTRVDLMVCGNLTIDELVRNHHVTVLPGGSALFTSAAAASLGARVSVLGNIGGDYPPTTLRLVQNLGLNTQLLRRTKEPTTRFRISHANTFRKLQLIESGKKVVSHQFKSMDAIHLGPVFGEISSSLVGGLRNRCNFMSADLQGFTRTVSPTGIVHSVLRDLNELSVYCDMVQASIEEARIQTGLRNPKNMSDALLTGNVQFAIVTMGSQGSWLSERCGNRYFVPAYPERRARDSTGAGDVFAGSWVHTYTITRDPVWASAAGSALASLTSRNTGLSKFRISLKELYRRANWVYDRVRS